MNSSVSLQELAGGEVAGVLAIEILSIPDISILGEGDGLDRETAVREFSVRSKREFSDLLSELFQRQANGSARGLSDELSVELLWSTHSVENQAYRAAIRLHLFLRTISATAAGVEATLKDCERIVSSALSLQKYEFRTLQADEAAAVASGLRRDSETFLVKDESVATLQNQILNECYAFDRIPESEQDLAKIANILVEYPDSHISFQLIPTRYSPEESTCLERMTNALETLTKGVRDQAAGNIGFALAEKHAETYKYYADRRNAALFSYSIAVGGPQEAVGNIASRVFGQLNGVPGREVRLRTVDLPASAFDFTGLYHPLPWALQECLREVGLNPAVPPSVPPAFRRLPFIVTAEEASEFFRLPIGSSRVGAGLVVNASGKRSRTYAKGIINAGDISVGRLKSSSRGDTIGFSLKDLTKHMLVVGTPGSGKTTFSVSLLDRLWKKHGIPFLVIEPAKNEYRALVQSIPELQVFTPGKSFISPFQFNPFVPPKNVTLEAYKSVLKTAFAAAVTMSSPLDKIFEEAVNDCYSDFRWLDTYTSADKGRVFNIQDFIKRFQKTFDAIGYTGDARNIGRAGVVRLNGLANLFDNYGTIPFEDLLTKPTVIELAAIENADQKALIIALLLLGILSYVNRNYLGDGNLKNVILLEEAHVLLDSESKGGEGAADPSAIAKGLVKRMLAEIRSYGVGLGIADQSPRKVGTDVVALTDIKLAFRLVEREDKEILADSTNMSEVQVQRLPRLKPGEAMLFFGKLEEPEEVATEDYRAANSIDISLTDEGIRDASTYWNDKLEQLRPYPQCHNVPECSGCCDFARRALAREIARRIVSRHFTQESKDTALLRKVYSSIERLGKAELNDEPWTQALSHCVRVHFLRKIKYSTKIPLSDQTIDRTIGRWKGTVQ